MVRYTLIFVANLTMRRSKMIERQKRFAAHYAETGNGAEAARRAGYSEAAARQTAYKLRQKDSILKRECLVMLAYRYHSLMQRALNLWRKS